MTSVDEDLEAARAELEQATTAIRELRRAWSASRDVSIAKSGRALEEATRHLAAARSRLDGAIVRASGHVWRPTKE